MQRATTSTPGVRVVLHPSDLPGQRSFDASLEILDFGLIQIYGDEHNIKSGDLGQEAYRLSTFLRFPHSNVDLRSLAWNGFYFTSCRDRIKCFSCGAAVENLSRDDGAHFMDWHSPECRFANGDQARNVSVGQRRSTLANFPITGGGDVNPSTSQRTTIREDAAHHSQEATSSLLVRADPAAETNRRMSSEQRDPLRCRYCNGGLQNWERDDDATVEYAKWFPMCQFVLLQKGPEFFHRIVSQVSNLRRPTLYNPCGNERNDAQLERQFFYGLEAISSSRSTAAAFSRPTASTLSRPDSASSCRPTSAAFFSPTAASSFRPAVAPANTPTAAFYRSCFCQSQRHRPYLLFCDLCDTDRHELCFFPVITQENASSSGQHVAPTGDVVEDHQEF